MEQNGAAEAWQMRVSAEAVEQSVGLSYVCVEECCWSTWQPGLPANVAAFLAEPVLVGAAPAADSTPHAAPSARCC